MTLRSRLLVLLTVAIAALGVSAGNSVVVSAAGPAESSPWAQSDGDAAHSRANLTEHVLTRSNLSYQVIDRRYIVAPSHPRGSVCSSNGAQYPVLSGGRVYGVFDGRPAAYSAATGKRLWRGPADPTRTTAYTSVSVSGSLVIMGTEYCLSMSDPSGSLVALRAGTGKPVWSTPAYGGNGVFDAVVEGNTVLAYENGDGGRNFTEAFDLSTGKSLWHAERCDVSPQALVVNGLAVFDACTANDAAVLVGADLRTGAHTWEGGPVDYLYAGDRSGAGAQHLYTSNYGDDFITDIDPATGKVQGQLAGATGTGVSTGILAVAGTRVFTTCSAGVCAYTESTHALSWSIASSAHLAAAANGVLYLSDGLVVDAYHGRLIRVLFSGQPASALAVGDGRVAEVPARSAEAYTTPTKTLHLFSLPDY